MHTHTHTHTHTRTHMHTHTHAHTHTRTHTDRHTHTHTHMHMRVPIPTMAPVSSFSAHRPATAQVFGLLVTGRVVTGVAVGAFSSTIFLYSAELSPPHIRGKLAGANQV